MAFLAQTTYFFEGNVVNCHEFEVSSIEELEANLAIEIRELKTYVRTDSFELACADLDFIARKHITAV